MEPVTVEPLQSPPTAVIVATGPSLTPQQIDILRTARERLFIIGVNNAFQECPFLDVLYAADVDWWNEFGDKVRVSERYSTWDSSAPIGFVPTTVKRVKYLRGVHEHGFAEQRDTILLGGHGGHHAIQLAIHFGCTDILLLGIDMSNLDGRTHCFGAYGIPRFDRRLNYSAYQPHMEEGARQAAARGIRIRNCSKRSVIECFEKVELRDVLTSDPVFGAP